MTMTTRPPIDEHVREGMRAIMQHLGIDRGITDAKQFVTTYGEQRHGLRGPDTVIGPCLESAGIRHGDLMLWDASPPQITSGDLIIVEVLPDYPDRGRYCKRIERLAGSWWLWSDQGMIPLHPDFHKVLGRLEIVMHRRRDLPMLYPEAYEAQTVTVTPEWTARMRETAAPGFAELEGQGPNRTAVYDLATAQTSSPRVEADAVTQCG